MRRTVSESGLNTSSGKKCEEHEISQLHIFDLAALGIAKAAVIQELAPLAQSLPGLVLIEYPVIPSDAFKIVSKKTTFPGMGAMDDDDEANWSDEEVGCDADGGLPEIVTQAIEKFRADQKAANLFPRPLSDSAGSGFQY